MRQISQSYKTGELALVNVAPPRAPGNGILVQTRASLISAGTERMIVDLAKKSLVEKARQRPDLVAKVFDKAKREGVLAAYDAVRSKLDSPIPLGYSLAGLVEEVGRSARGFQKGDRVACAGAGIANHAELNAVPMNLAVQIPENVTDEEASFVTVAAIALQGVRLVHPQLGDVVVVIGLGLIGQITVSLLVAHGCKVVGVDLDPSKAELAKARGASAAGVTGRDDVIELVRAASGGYGADSVVITASAPTAEPLALAGEVARDKARISVVGLLPLEIPRKAYYEKELEVIVSRSYGPGRYDPDYEERGHDYPIGYVRWTERRNLEAVLFAISTGRLDVKSLITHRYPFERALDAYDLITGKIAEPHLGVVLTYAEEPKRPPFARAAPRERTSAGVGIAVIGTGAFATGVLVPALSKVSGARIVTAVSGRGLSALNVADKFGQGDVDATLDDALSRSDVDAVVISTRHDSHAYQAAKALAAGRDVFLEKPAAVTEEQLDLLKTEVERSSARLMVGFNRRFSPFATQVKQSFAGRAGGLVMVARVNAGRIPGSVWVHHPEEGGGRIIGEACHFIDLMTFWAGALPVRVSAHAIGPDGGYRRDDNVVIGLSFKDGSVGTLIYTAMGDPSVCKERYEVYGQGKVAVIDNWRTLTLTSRGKAKTTRALRADKGHAAELDAFVESCRTRSPSPISWVEIEAVTRATFAIEQARVEGTSVELILAGGQHFAG